MKKNKIMRFASLVLVLTLLSTCAISGTFAKYTSTGSATDSARVAKWGVTVSATAADTNELFVKEYKNGETVTVKASEAIVAPGTSGDFTNFDISGTPEVSTSVTYSATVTLANWVCDSSNTFYCPLIVTVGGKDYDGLDYKSADEFAGAIKAAIENCKASYTPGQDLTAVEDDMDISWSWPFVGTTERSGQTDVKDTYLGNQAAAGSAATITINVSATIEQVD